MVKISLVAALFLVVFASAADAQVETVVVTAQRVGNDGEAPAIVLERRADHLITKVRVVCDTRDLDKRKDELRQTLRNMISSAGKSISLSVGDAVLADFTSKMLDKVIVPDSKSDTSDAFVVVRTELMNTDTFDDATQRIKDYIARVPKAGRTEILTDQAWNLGLIEPERYRSGLISKIADDAHKTAQIFGAGYEARVEGLQRPIQWYQSGALDLALYIPYGLVIAPRGAQ